MSKTSSFTYLSLKKRGWSDALMESLLPRPHVVYTHGRPLRIWRRRDVLAA